MSSGFHINLLGEKPAKPPSILEPKICEGCGKPIIGKPHGKPHMWFHINCYHEMLDKNHITVCQFCKWRADK